MKVLAFDVETDLIRPANLAPALVCVTWQSPGEVAGIAHVSEAEPLFRGWLEDKSIVFVGHNVAFDFAVTIQRFPKLTNLVFEAYENDRVTDTMIRAQLLDIAAGCFRAKVDAKGKRTPVEYTLEATAKRYAGLRLVKDGWRTRYAAFLNTPIKDWPAKAAEVLEAAKQELEEVLEELEQAKAEKDDAKVKALAKERDAIQEMLTNDPNRCTEYALEDTRATLSVYQTQERHAAQYLKDQYRQARAAFGLYLSSARGICVDAEGLQKLKQQIEEEERELEEELIAEGLVREDGTRDTKAAKALMIRVCKEEGIPVVRTDAHFDQKLTWAQRQEKGLKPRCKAEDGSPLDDGHDDCFEHVCLDADACERTGDSTLDAYAKRTTLRKQLSNDIPALEKGVVYPVHTRYGLAATCRSTSSRPSMHNQSNRPGFREAFIARPGYLFAECDYPTLELYTLAQCCIKFFGYSELGDAIRSGKDVHLFFAAKMLRKTYEWALENKGTAEVKKTRKLSKSANFGFPGGMGIKKFVDSTRKAMLKQPNGRAEWEALELTVERARGLKEEWLSAFPEMQRHFERVAELTDTADGTASVETLFTGRWRGKATYCAVANNGFQALGADCAKNAVWRVAKEQYADRASALWGTRTVAFVHDELIIEVKDDDRAHDAAYRLARVMAEAANEFLPDVPIPVEKMEPVLMKRWSKNATSRFDDNGRLIAWDRA